MTGASKEHVDQLLTSIGNFVVRATAVALAPAGERVKPEFSHSTIDSESALKVTLLNDSTNEAKHSCDVTCTEQEQHQDLLSVPQAVSNMANAVIGVGVLSVPYAFKLSGYCAILLLGVVILITARSAHFIGEALIMATARETTSHTPPKARDFGFLAYAAFGARGRTFIGAVAGVEVWFALVTFLVMNGVNASLVWPNAERSVAIACCAALSTAMVFVPMKFFSYLSVLSSLSLAMASVAMVAAAMSMPSWATPRDEPLEEALANFENVPRSVGILVFCFAGHPCFPMVHESLQEKQRWRVSVNVTFFIALLYYGGMGIFGFLVFGEHLEASFTENVGMLPHATFLRVLAAAAFLVKIQLTAPLLLSTVLVSVCAPPAEGPEWSARRIAMLLGISALTGMAASTLSEEVAVVASLTGSLFTMITSVLFPAMVHRRLRRLSLAEEPGLCRQLSYWLVVVFGIAMAVAGTATAAMDLAGGK